MSPSIVSPQPSWSFNGPMKTTGHAQNPPAGMQMSQASTPDPHAVGIASRGTTTTMAEEGLPNTMTLLALFSGVKEAVVQDLANFEKQLTILKEHGTTAGSASTEKELADPIGEGGDHAGQKNGKKSIFGGTPSKISVSSEEPDKTTWIPLPVRRLKPLTSDGALPQALLPLPLTTPHTQTFTLNFLVGLLGGSEVSPGFFYPATGPPKSSASPPTNNALLPKSKTFYAIDANFEPFLPKVPGEHGAKLSVLFRDMAKPEKRYTDVPLFVCLDSPAADDGSSQPSAEQQYTYLGNYTQSRWSDKLDYDRMAEVVPQHVKMWWAEKLAARPDRPKWMENKLMEVFWPTPEYQGPLPRGGETTVTGEISKEGENNEDGVDMKHMKKYLQYLKGHEEDSRIKVGLLKKENILEAFERSDAAEEPGLRFWWEYLECVGYDRNFYYMLATASKDAAAELAKVA